MQHKKNRRSRWLPVLFRKSYCADMICLLPFESGETVDIQGENADRDEIFEDGLHPALDLQSLACISFFYEVVPAPSELVAAEY